MSTWLDKESLAVTPLAANGVNQTLVVVRGIVGAALGGAVGYLVFRLLAKNGLYGMLIPGALLGLGAGLAARSRSQLLGVVCAVTALLLSVFAEWSLFPFVKDASLAYFVTHVHTLPAIKLIMMAVGVGLAYWLGQGR
jgi:hypothetical protein